MLPALLCAQSCLAAAPNLGVSPLVLTVASQSPSGQLQLTNTGAAPDRLQTRLFRWSREQCHDRLEPTQSLVASPPILTVAASGRQLVRVLLVDEQSRAIEGTYRIELMEIGDVAPPPGVVTTRLNLSIPIFVTPTGNAKSSLRWSVTRKGQGLSLAVTNAGNIHDRLRGITVLDAEGKSLATEARSDYLLAGDSCNFELPAGSSVVVKAESGETTLPVPPP